MIPVSCSRMSETMLGQPFSNSMLLNCSFEIETQYFSFYSLIFFSISCFMFWDVEYMWSRVFRSNLRPPAFSCFSFFFVTATLCDPCVVSSLEASEKLLELRFCWVFWALLRRCGILYSLLLGVGAPNCPYLMLSSPFPGGTFSFEIILR